MSDTTRTVAVLGAGGTMGRAMAANLLRAGLRVRAHNRSREKAEPLAGEGAAVVDTPAEAAAGADVLLTMLSDGDAVLEAAGAALAGGRAPATWVQTSTIGIEATERCAALAAEHGMAFVDAPVLGTKQPAEAGELVVLASGPEEERERLAPIFRAIGKKTVWAGAAGQGSRLKLATNAWLVAIVEGAAESLVLAQALGLDPELFLEAVADGPLDPPFLGLKGRAMLKRDFTPSFRLELAAKDARLARTAAQGADLELPLLEAVADRFTRAARDHGDEDLSAVYLASAPEG